MYLFIVTTVINTWKWIFLRKSCILILISWRGIKWSQSGISVRISSNSPAICPGIQINAGNLASWRQISLWNYKSSWFWVKWHVMPLMTQRLMGNDFECLFAWTMSLDLCLSVTRETASRLKFPSLFPFKILKLDDV